MKRAKNELVVKYFLQFGNMSRIGKRPIPIPEGVQVTFDGAVLTVKGPKGTLHRDIRKDVAITIADDTVVVTPALKTRIVKSLWGTYASHITNMVIGVTEGYRKILLVTGVGYRVEKKGETISLKVGFSHTVDLSIPQGLSVEVKDNTITIDGFDKELVGAFAAEVRAVKKAEPYKGKGIRYHDEVVRRKQGKKAATAA